MEACKKTAPATDVPLTTPPPFAFYLKETTSAAATKIITITNIKIWRSGESWAAADGEETQSGVHCELLPSTYPSGPGSVCWWIRGWRPSSASSRRWCKDCSPQSRIRSTTATQQRAEEEDTTPVLWWATVAFSWTGATVQSSMSMRWWCGSIMPGPWGLRDLLGRKPQSPSSTATFFINAPEDFNAFAIPMVPMSPLSCMSASWYIWWMLLSAVPCKPLLSLSPIPNLIVWQQELWNGTQPRILWRRRGDLWVSGVMRMRAPHSITLLACKLSCLRSGSVMRWTCLVLGSSMEQSITTIPHRRKSFPCMIMKPSTSSMMILSTEDLRPFHFSKKQALKSPQCISFNDTVDTSAFYKEQLLPCHLLSSPCQLFLPPFPDQLIVTGFLQQLKHCVQGPRRSIPELSEAWMSCRAWFGLFSYAVLLKQNILPLTRSELHSFFFLSWLV